MSALVVVRTGPLALVEDLGRAGHAHLGVPPSGALDVPALRRANALVGNPAAAAGVECVLGGLVLRADGACVLAVTGAACAIRIRGAASGSGSAAATDVPFGAAFELADGAHVRLGSPPRGLRCYLAARGGVDVPAELGSRSTDVLTGIGPAPLRVGDTLPIGLAPSSADAGGHDDGDGDGDGDHGDGDHGDDTDGRDDTDGGRDPVVVPVVLGPRDAWFPDAAAQLARGEWTVSPSSNRVGVRLSGTALRRARDGELPTEAVVTGAIQVPPSGEPMIFLNDHPTTGGYPVIGVVPPRGLPLLAQARPGAPIRLRVE